MDYRATSVKKKVFLGSLTSTCFATALYASDARASGFGPANAGSKRKRRAVA